MKIGVYFCECGANISGKVDPDKLMEALSCVRGFGFFHRVGFMCSEGGLADMEAHLREHRPGRVVVAACSVREHEETFRGALSRAGINPFLLQLVNVREHVAWVTEDSSMALEKAARQVRAAMARVLLQVELERTEMDVNADVMVIGSGPAGLKAALTAAEAGRRVVLVEEKPLLGGMPVTYEEIFPNMECGPCLLEPLLGEILHGPNASRIEVFTMSEVAEVVGFFGHFTATIRKRPRRVSTELCISCGECASACPVSVPNPYNYGLDQRKAVDVPFQGALPNLPYIDESACLRTARGEDCTLCRDACVMDGAIVYDEGIEVVRREVGAIVVATGAELYDCAGVPNLGHGAVPGVYNSLEFERLLAKNGPTGGKVTCASGDRPRSVAFLHCVGSLDERRKPYCSLVCCSNAFKADRVLAHCHGGTAMTHYIKTVCVPGKEEFKLYDAVRRDGSASFVRYEDIDAFSVTAGDAGGVSVALAQGGGGVDRREFDVVVLCPALVPSRGTGRAAKVLELTLDRFGFIDELGGRIDSARSKVRGIYAAGACQSPADIQKAANQAGAAAGGALSALVPGRKLIVEPVTAEVDGERCSGCRTCVPVCPYKAITFDAEKGAASVNRVLCTGCGTCVAACPAGVIRGDHFTDGQILAEITEVLA